MNAPEVHDATTEAPPPSRPGLKPETLSLVVPMMLFTSSLIMALAWIGHLRFKELPFYQALLACWLLVFPEYLLNILAVRIGIRVFTGAQMASFNLCSGVVCVALVSRFYLGETISPRAMLGFVLMVIAMLLISLKPDENKEDAWS